MLCPSCQTDNDASAGNCRSCGQPLALGPGAVIAGRYEIQGILGEGGMGTVYRAHDRSLEEAVALKVLRPNFAQTPEADRRFRSEIKLARKVSHRNVCRIHEYGEDGALRYLSMELVDGVNLKQAVRGKGGLPLEEARELTIQIAKGLQSIHDVGIIHRDLKTANIMWDTAGVIRLMDFGIAKKWQDDLSEGMTGVGDIIGTPEYMSPEQARGQRLDFRSDIYALGIVLFELLTGELPFKGPTPLDTLLKHVQEAPPLAGRVPPVAIPILQKALAKDPGDRYASCRGLVADLRATVPGAQPARPHPASALVANLAEAAPAALGVRDDSDVVHIDTPTEFDAISEAAEPADVAALARVRELMMQLKDPEVKVRWKAALALCGVGPAGREAVDALAQAIDDEAGSVSEAAAEAYKRITGQTPPARKPKPAAPAGPPPAVLSLMEALKSSDSFQRWRAVLGLGEMGPAAATAVSALVEALDDQDDNVRWAAATAIGKLGPAAREAVPALAAALSDRDDPLIHRHAAAALGRLGSTAKDGVPGLIGALRDKDSTVRDEVVDALVRIGAAAVPALIEALQDEDDRVRFEAADALTKIGTNLKTAKA